MIFLQLRDPDGAGSRARRHYNILCIASGRLKPPPQWIVKITALLKAPVQKSQSKKAANKHSFLYCLPWQLMITAQHPQSLTHPVLPKGSALKTTIKRGGEKRGVRGGGKSGRLHPQVSMESHTESTLQSLLNNVLGSMSCNAGLVLPQPTSLSPGLSSNYQCKPSFTLVWIHLLIFNPWFQQITLKRGASFGGYFVPENIQERL